MRLLRRWQLPLSILTLVATLTVTLFAATASDTFVEGGGNVNLNAHTPTGPNAGTSWSALSGQINVDATSDFAEDINSSAGNRYLMDNDLGFGASDTQAVFTSAGNANTAPGVIFGRSNVGGGNCEAGYDHSAGQWVVDGASTASTATEAWPGGSVTMLVELRAASITLKIGGVTKVTHNGDSCTGHYSGLRLLNFSGGAGEGMTADDYTSVGVDEGGGPAATINCRFFMLMGVGGKCS
jgi:hypothetical protein